MRAKFPMLYAAAALIAAASAASATPSFSPDRPSGQSSAPAPSGLASIQCVLADQGALTGCKLLGESPAGLGLGDEALKMSRIMKMPGGQAGKIVTIPVRFILTPDRAAAQTP